eukprot:gene5498-5904_t
MFSRRAVQLVKTVAQRQVVAPTPKLFAVRYMGSNVTHPPGLEDHVGHQADYTNTKDVVVPELVDTLEWVLESPPNVHQFDEPPIVVEIEHLKNVKGPEHH